MRVLGVGGKQLFVDRMRLGDEGEARTLVGLLVVEAGGVLVDLRQVAEDARFIGPLAEERLVDRLAAGELLGGVRAVGEGAAGVGQILAGLEVGPDLHRSLGELDGAPSMLPRGRVGRLVEKTEGEVALQHRRLVQRVGAVGVDLREPRDELLGFPQRPARSLDVAHVGVALDALNASELHVGG